MASSRARAALPAMLLLPFLACADASPPADVSRFVERRELCDHFRNEPWPEGRSAADLERRDFLVRQSAVFCGDADARLSALRRKYGADARILELLDRYQPVAGQ